QIESLRSVSESRTFPLSYSQRYGGARKWIVGRGGGRSVRIHLEESRATGAFHATLVGMSVLAELNLSNARMHLRKKPRPASLSPEFALRSGDDAVTWPLSVINGSNQQIKQDRILV